MPAILAVDTSLGACSAAVIAGGATVAARFEVLGRGHAERLMPMVEEVMAESGMDYPALEAVAVTVGPGAFTGVRIGLAAARGLALALDVPLIGVTSLEAVAVDLLLQDPPSRRHAAVTVVHDGRRGEVYMQSFEPAGDGGFPELVAIDDAAAVPIAEAGNKIPRGAVVVGTGIALIEDRLRMSGLVCSTRAEPAYPDAIVVARIAAERMAKKQQCKFNRPLYLRSPDARLPQCKPDRATASKTVSP